MAQTSQKKKKKDKHTAFVLFFFLPESACAFVRPMVLLQPK